MAQDEHDTGVKFDDKGNMLWTPFYKLKFLKIDLLKEPTTAGAAKGDEKTISDSDTDPSSA